MQRVMHVFPREHHPYMPLLIPLCFNTRLGIGCHKLSYAGGPFHPHCIELTFQPVNLAFQGMLSRCGSSEASDLYSQ